MKIISKTVNKRTTLNPIKIKHLWIKKKTRTQNAEKNPLQIQKWSYLDVFIDKMQNPPLELEEGINLKMFYLSKILVKMNI